MTQNISEEDQKKICAMFFYLQDISLELQACSNILHQIKEKLEDSEENVLALATLSRVIFNYTVINVFKAGELIYNNQGFIKDYFPKSLEKLNKFKSEFWTNNLKNYRNKYVAHHSDKKKKEREDTSPFLSRGELLKLMCRILKIDNESKMIEGLVRYMSKLYNKSNFLEGDKDTLCYTINNLSSEIKGDLKIELERN